MAKARKVQKVVVSVAPVTHEPEEPINWPDGHVAVKETNNRVEECISVTIHGVEHYLHATTAYELLKMLDKTITLWDKKAKAHGFPGVIGVD